MIANCLKSNLLGVQICVRSSFSVIEYIFDIPNSYKCCCPTFLHLSKSIETTSSVFSKTNVFDPHIIVSIA